MMGLRGCRLPICYPEIGELLVRAIFEAGVYVQKERCMYVVPEIMVPLVGSSGELRFMRKLISTVADAVIAEKGAELTYLVGTMIELPRAAVSADRIAAEAEFFSFGTNDLTQMTYGLSRDDSGSFLPVYLNKKIFESDPFPPAGAPPPQGGGPGAPEKGWVKKKKQQKKKTKKPKTKKKKGGGGVGV
jgi:pyruvate,orthophosphate dikinase